MANLIQFPSHKEVGTAEIQNNSYLPKAAQKGLEAGSSIQSSSSEGFFSSIITKIVNFFKWIFCCGSSKKEPSDFAKYFDSNIKGAFPQYSGLADDKERVDVAVRIVKGEVGNMDEPKKHLNFRLEVARELVKSGLASPIQQAEMHHFLREMAQQVTKDSSVFVRGDTLETILQGFADQKDEIDRILTRGPSDSEVRNAFNLNFSTLYIPMAFPQYNGLDDDTEALAEVGVRIVEGEIGNMGEPRRLNFRILVANKLVKSGFITGDQKRRMNVALQTLTKHLSGVTIEGSTLEETLLGFHSQNSRIDEILTKKVGEDTAQRKVYLMQWLDENGFSAGEAVDNGDCFFAAFAESLSEHKSYPFTHKQLRQEVSKASLSTIMQEKIHRDGGFGGYNNVLDWIDNITKSWDEGVIPVWGRGRIEGVLLCNKYDVNLVIYDVYEDNESFKIAENEFKPESGKAAQTIYMASYPGHFFPISKSL